jgi:zinc-ribbon domain
MEPEISHRCTSCGASVRGHALFCPECGHPLTRKTANGGHEGSAVSESESDVKAAATDEPAANEVEPAPASDPETETPAAIETTAKGEPAPESDVAGEPIVESAQPSAEQPASESAKPVTPQPARPPGRLSTGRDRAAASTALAANKARTKIQKATTAARDKLEDNVRPRVDKIRQASTVVLEEASDDPSVRFILVAGALFVLFLILLILSKVI